MRQLSALFVLTLSLVAFAQSESPLSPQPIIPAPRFQQARTGDFKISSTLKIVLGEGTSKEDRFTAEQFNEALSELRIAEAKIAEEEELRKFGTNVLFIGSPKGTAAKRLMKERSLELTPDMKREGYVLDVNRDGIVIIGESAQGRFYGMMSLLQLLSKEKKSVTVKGVSIRDWPLQATRGITDDLSRNQVSTLENFKTIVRFLARYKMNVYSPYIEDIFAFKSHPMIGRGRGTLTAAEMKELDAYAKRYHVELIPIFETLGHWENILAMPEYVQYAEFPGAHTVNISDERVYKMLDEMIGELAGCFSSPYFNIAADESWDVGLGANKERVAKSDLATVHAEHYKRLFEIVKKYKKKPMMYGDILLDSPAILTKIPPEVVIVDWHYGAAASYTSPKIFGDAGFPYVVSPAVWNFTGPFPNYLNTFVNIQNLNHDGFQNHSLGILTSNWNDYGGEALRELNYYGYAWTGECAWNPLTADAAVFNGAFWRDYFGSEEAATAAQTVYAILSEPANQLNWHELWRHPFLPQRAAQVPAVLRLQSISLTMPIVQQQLDRLAATAVRNKQHVAFLNFVVRTNKWFAQKLESADLIQEMGRAMQEGANKDSIQTEAAAVCDSVIDHLESMKAEFKRLWLTTNRPDNLEWLMKRYDRQLAWWEEKRGEVRGGNFASSPVLESPYIYHPAANPRKRDTLLTQAPKAFFRKTFTVSDTTVPAMLQFIGDTHVKVWVNGTEIGESYVRTSLSLMIEYQRVKLVDIGKYLRKGTNVIAVQAASYGTFSSAGCNIYAELGKTTLMTDSTWRVSQVEESGWKLAGFNDTAWSFAKAVPYPLAVTKPNFLSKRSSWVER